MLSVISFKHCSSINNDLKNVLCIQTKIVTTIEEEKSETL